MVRLVRLAAFGILALMPVAHSGCSLDGCRAGSFRCDGEVAQTCARSDGTEFYDWQTIADCASQGQVCHEGSATAECIYPDRPCLAAACSGGQAIACGTSGFVTGTELCDAEATCELDGNHVACVYTQASCGPGVTSFCAVDGVTLYSGCDEGFGAPTRRVVCDGLSPVCVTQTQGYATCGS